MKTLEAPRKDLLSSKMPSATPHAPARPQALTRALQETMLAFQELRQSAFVGEAACRVLVSFFSACLLVRRS